MNLSREQTTLKICLFHNRSSNNRFCYEDGRHIERMVAGVGAGQHARTKVYVTDDVIGSSTS